MKRPSLIFAFLLAAWLPLAAKEQQMSVQVKESAVRASPSFLGKIVKRVAYGDTLTVSGTLGGWSSVALPGTKTNGWIHVSALTERRIVLSAGTAAAQNTATSDEVMLAGKGFSAEVEADYRGKHASLDYSRVDAMERYAVGEKGVADFAREGELRIRGAQ